MSKQSKRMLQVLTIAFAIFAAFGLTRSAAAFATDDDGYIPANVVIDDDISMSYQNVVVDGTINGNVFISAETVEINGVINGNLLVNAATLEISGVVNGSAAIAGQALELTGTVNGTVYAAGASFIVGPEAHIQRNLLFTGFNLEIQEGATIDRDISISGYQVRFAGEVGGNIEADAGAFEIGGQINGGVFAKISESGQIPDFSWMDIWANSFSTAELPPTLETGLRVSENAQINGELRYLSPEDQSNAILTTPRQGVIYEPNLKIEGQINPGTRVLDLLRDFLTFLVLGGLLLWKFPNSLHATRQYLSQKPWTALGQGFLALASGIAIGMVFFLTVIFLGVLLAIVTLGGLAGLVFGLGFASFGIYLTAFIITVKFVSKTLAAFWVGSLLINQFAAAHADKKWAVLFFGILVYILLRAIPLAGGIIAIVATLFGMGSIWKIGLDKKKK